MPGVDLSDPNFSFASRTICLTSHCMGSINCTADVFFWTCIKQPQCIDQDVLKPLSFDAKSKSPLFMCTQQTDIDNLRT